MSEHPKDNLQNARLHIYKLQHKEEAVKIELKEGRAEKYSSKTSCKHKSFSNLQIAYKYTCINLMKISYIVEECSRSHYNQQIIYKKRHQ